MFKMFENTKPITRIPRYLGGNNPDTTGMKQDPKTACNDIFLY